MNMSHASAALFAVGALCLGASAAHAQSVDGQGAFALTGDTRLAPSLDEFSIDMPVFEDVEVGKAPTDPRPTVISDTDLASTLAWYERFTLAPSASRPVWSRSSDGFPLQLARRWGVTLGYFEVANGFSGGADLQDFSAGAFIEFSDRFHFSSELRFTSPGAEAFGEENEERAPEIRFESAFRF